MNNMHVKWAMYAVVVMIAIMIGSWVLAATFFGLCTLAGLIALIESIPFLKWFVKKTTSLIDLLIFGLTIAAVTAYGLNISAALTIAGLGFTLVYAPYVRKEKQDKKNQVVRYKDNCNRM